MKEIVADIWTYGNAFNAYIVIPTNGSVKKNGECVMGRGLALQAKNRFPDLPKRLGGAIQRNGNRVYIFENRKLITFPVKHYWWQKADLELIETSAAQLREAIYTSPDELVLIPKVGCGNGGRSWNAVKPILEKEMKKVKNIIVCDLK